MQQHKTTLEIRDLTVSFKRRGVWSTVINNIDFDVREKETLALVGESGSGKSVTSMAIMRLLDPALSKVEGSIRLGSTELLRLSEAEMRKVRGERVAMIFQEPMTSLNPVMTAGSQVVEALRVHRGISETAARKEALHLFERVRIPAAKSRMDEYPHQFSGGMRQRIMIAMALALKPDLLIADEPTTALDVTIQAQIINLLKEIQREDGMSMLFITHDMGVVAEVADRTLVMCRGDKIEDGPTEGIFRHPRLPYTKGLLAAVPELGAMKGTTVPEGFAVAGEVPEPVAIDPRQPGRKPLLEVRDLVTRFDIPGRWGRGISARVHAVEKVSFDLYPGETLSVVGESGSGKSSLGNSIARLVTPKSGSVMLKGQDLTRLQGEDLRKARRMVQVVFQDPFASLNPRMTVGDAIAEPAVFHDGISRDAAETRVAELLRQVGLDASMSNRYPHEFSGGQRQRICIARALAMRPDLIIADECVSALDVSIKAQVVNLMLKLQRDLGLSYLFISHDMAIVERVSHRVAVMYLGEIVEIGSRAEIFENPQHPYTRRLLASVPVADPARRHNIAPVDMRELPNALRPADYVPPARRYSSVGASHMVQDWSDNATFGAA